MVLQEGAGDSGVDLQLEAVGRELVELDLNSGGGGVVHSHGQRALHVHGFDQTVARELDGEFLLHGHSDVCGGCGSGRGVMSGRGGGGSGSGGIGGTRAIGGDLKVVFGNETLSIIHYSLSIIIHSLISS